MHSVFHNAVVSVSQRSKMFSFYNQEYHLPEVTGKPPHCDVCRDITASQ